MDRPGAAAVLAAVVAASACTFSRRPLVSPTPAFPVVRTRSISGASPFARCPRADGITADSEVEPSLAVDPEDPAHLLAAWQQDRNARGGTLGIVTAVSSNGGTTWRRILPPHLTACTQGPYDLASDPAVSIGTDRAYLAAIGIHTIGSGQDVRFDTDVIVSPSVDGGGTWGDPVAVAGSDDPLVSFDKETVLASTRLDGTAYASWVQYTSTRAGVEARVNATYFSRTTDGGSTWSEPIRSHGGDTETQFHQLVELPDGTLLDVFIEAPSLSDRPPIAAHLSAIRSTDGGLTWSGAITVAGATFTKVTDPTGKDQLRGTGQGILAAAGADGVAYVAWAEEHRGVESFVNLVRSDDGGLTWSPPATVTRTSGQPFIPSVAVAGDGTVGVTWYEVASVEQGPLSTDVRLAWSGDRGETWRRLRLAGPFDFHTAPLSADGDFVGDYQGLVGLPRGFAAVDAMAKPPSRSGPTDLFFSTVRLGP